MESDPIYPPIYTTIYTIYPPDMLTFSESKDNLQKNESLLRPLWNTNLPLS